MSDGRVRDVVIVGAGPAGLSAAIYLGRALRDTTVIHHGHPMARWEPRFENYLGFPESVSGEDLLARGREQAEQFGVEFVEGQVCDLSRSSGLIVVHAGDRRLRARRVLLATGIYHRPPDIPGVSECLGHSLFFCKDCDGWRVRGKSIAIFGRNDDAVEYALGFLAYSPKVMIVTNAERPIWDDRHQAWLDDHEIPVLEGRVVAVEHEERRITALCFEGGRRVGLDVAFTTRGDVYHNQLALALGARVDHQGQVQVDDEGRTDVPGLFAAGCLTPANCQAIVAAGQGAMAAQAINRELFEEDLAGGRIKRARMIQLREHETRPQILG